MAFSRLAGLPLAVPLAGLVALHPEPAEACSPNPCSWRPFVNSLNALSTASIPADGVLLLRVTGENFGNEDILGMLKLEVTQNGQPVAGAVEDTGAVGVLAWRPVAPLPTGLVHQVHAVLEDTYDDEYGYYDCGAELLELDLEFMAEASPSQPLGVPQAQAQEEVFQVADSGIETLVCCDDAIPSDYDGCGYDGQPYWSDGECTQSSGRGFLQVALAVEPGVDDPLTRAQLLIGLRVDGNLEQLDELPTKGFTSAAPFCTQIEVRNVGSGEVVLGPEQCHGGAVAASLGPQPIDPHIALDGVCTGPLYTCEIEPESFPPRWDPMQCEDWDEEVGTTVDPSDTAPTSSDSASASDADGTASSDGPGENDLVEHGCACTTGPADPGALLGLAGLGLLARRRRRAV